MSLPWLKGAISGPIRAYGLTVTAAHFSDDRRLGEGGGRERRAEQVVVVGVLLCCFALSA